MKTKDLKHGTFRIGEVVGFASAYGVVTGKITGFKPGSTREWVTVKPPGKDEVEVDGDHVFKPKFALTGEYIGIVLVSKGHTRIVDVGPDRAAWMVKAARMKAAGKWINYRLFRCSAAFPFFKIG